MAYFSDLMGKNLIRVEKYANEEIKISETFIKKAFLKMVIIKYPHVVDDELPEPTNNLYTKMVNERKMRLFKQKLSEKQAYQLILKYTNFIKKKSKLKNSL